MPIKNQNAYDQIFINSMTFKMLFFLIKIFRRNFERTFFLKNKQFSFVYALMAFGT